MHALVTGATGMIGGAIVDLLRARGYRVRALARPTAKIDHLLVQGVDVVVGDLGDEESLRQAVQRVDVVFHAAAVLGAFANPQILDDVNSSGTARLLAACQAARVERFVHISSVAVYGPQPPPVAENAALTPNSPYGHSKLTAEQAVWRAHEAGLAVSTLRPCVVYGPGDRYFTPSLLQLMRLPVLPLPDGGDTQIELVYVTDVAQAAVQAALAPRAVGQAYNVTDGRPTSLRNIVDTYAVLTGHAPRVVDISLARLNQLAGVLRDGLTPIAPTLASLLRPDLLRNLEYDSHYPIAKAERELGYVPQVGLYEGLRRSLEAVNPNLLYRASVPNLPLLAVSGLALGGLVAGAAVRRAVQRRRQ